MKIIIVGCGRVGSELAERLDAEGQQVVIIDQNSENFQRLALTFQGRMITGVGFDHDVLSRAGIDTADAVAVVLPNDAANLIVARAAHDHFKVPLVVARLYDPRKADLYEHSGFQTVSSTIWTVSRLEQIITSRKLNHLASLGNGEVHVLEMHIAAHMASRPISSLLVTGEVAVVGLTRGGRTCIPSLDTSLEEGDLLCLSATTTAMGRLEMMMRQGG